MINLLNSSHSVNFTPFKAIRQFSNQSTKIISAIPIPPIFGEFVQDKFYRTCKDIDTIRISTLEIKKCSDELSAFAKTNSQMKNFYYEANHALNNNPANLVILSSPQPILSNISDLKILGPTLSLAYSSLFCGLSSKNFQLSPMSLNLRDENIKLATLNVFEGTLPLDFHQDYYLKRITSDRSNFSKISLIPFAGIFNTMSNSNHKTQLVLNDEIIENLLNHFPRSYDILSKVNFTVFNSNYKTYLENVKIITTLSDHKKSLLIFDENCQFKFNQLEAKRLNLKEEDIKLAHDDLNKAIKMSTKQEAVLNDNKDQIIFFNNQETVHGRAKSDQIKDADLTKQPAKHIRLIGFFGMTNQARSK
jgi:hypothetical protein